MPCQNAPSIGDRRRFIAALQDCIVQIGRMRFARIECYDYALVRKIDFYVLNSGNILQHRSQFAHALIAIFTFSGDLDRFQNSVVGAFREKWIGRIGISRSCRVHRVFLRFSCASGPAVVFLRSPSVLFARLNSKARAGTLALLCHFACHRFEHTPNVFSKDLLTGCIRVNAIAQIQ